MFVILWNAFNVCPAFALYGLYFGKSLFIVLCVWYLTAQVLAARGGVPDLSIRLWRVECNVGQRLNGQVDQAISIGYAEHMASAKDPRCKPSEHWVSMCKMSKSSFSKGIT